MLMPAKRNNMVAVTTVAVSFLMAASILAEFAMLQAYAFSNASSVNVINAMITVTGSCFISLNTNVINFGQIPAGSNTARTLNDITVNDPFGNIAANVLISGTNWISTSSSANFFVSNTIWNPTNDFLANGNALLLFPSQPTDTKIEIPAPNVINPNTDNLIYFGLYIPTLTALGVYTQNIVLENSC